MFLRRIARPLMAKVKETTGIVGLDVVPNAREVLISLYSKTLKEIQAVPVDESYRKAVESFTRHRLKVFEEESDWDVIEKRLGCGQVEELIEEAKDELTLLSELNGAAKMFLRRIARPLTAKVKETTGIVGLDVVPNAREVLISLYSKTLKEIQAVPEDEGYRKAVESFTRHRLQVCEEESDWDVIEKRLGCGQVEELIEEAKDELTLLSKLNEWKPWGIDDDYECEVIENDAPVPKHIPLHRPGPLPEEFYKTMEAVTSKPVEAIASEPVIEPGVTDGDSKSKQQDA